MSKYTVQGILSSVRNSLNDNGDEDCRHWTDAELLDYFNDSVCLLSSHRPDAFTKSVTLTLKKGACQDFSSQYQCIVSIDYNVDSKGECDSDSPVSEGDFDLIKCFSKKSCSSKTSSKGVGSFAVDPANPAIVYVSPAVDKVTKVIGKVVERPDPLSLTSCIDFDCKYIPALKDYMLHRAYAKDIESAAAMQRSERHLQMFFEHLRTGYRQEARFKSGYYLGQEGDGDERASVR